MKLSPYLNFSSASMRSAGVFSTLVKIMACSRKCLVARIHPVMYFNLGQRHCEQSEKPSTIVKHPHLGHLFATGQPCVSSGSKFAEGVGLEFVVCDIDDVVQ